MSNSDNPLAKLPRMKSEGTVQTKPRPGGTAFEKDLMNGFAERLRERASRSATYMEVKNEYGSAIRLALDAGVGMDEFVAIYSEHKKQVTGEPLSSEQASKIRESFKQLRADWSRGKLKSRNVSSNSRPADKADATTQGRDIVEPNSRHEDKSIKMPMDFEVDNREASDMPRPALDGGAALPPNASPTPEILIGESNYLRANMSDVMNVEPSSFAEET